jgi:NAD(P)-dependent dehydrogenase (short-subunit alcohol dehydrogenase family)
VRVLVTGHRGYLGVVVARVLQADGFDVIGLDSDLYRECTFGDPATLPKVPEIAEDISAMSARPICAGSMPSCTLLPSGTTRSATSIRADDGHQS